MVRKQTEKRRKELSKFFFVLFLMNVKRPKFSNIKTLGGKQWSLVKIKLLF